MQPTYYKDHDEEWEWWASPDPAPIPLRHGYTMARALLEGPDHE